MGTVIGIIGGGRGGRLCEGQKRGKEGDIIGRGR